MSRIRLNEGSKNRAPILLPLIGIDKSRIRANETRMPTKKQAYPKAQGLGI